MNIVAGWNVAGWEPMGLWRGDDLYSRRYDHATEYVQILRSLWRDGECALDGKLFRLDGCVSLPKPTGATRAGASERGRRFTAEYRDFNFTNADDPESLARAKAQLAEAAAVTGRTVASIVVKTVVLCTTDAEANRRAE